MPHQCLKCGKVFDENSSKLLLKGCPNCGGTRFFFTKEPLSEDEREEIAEKLDEDLREKIVKLMKGGQKIKFFDKEISLMSKDEKLEKASEKEVENKDAGIVSEEDIEKLIEDDEARKKLIEKLLSRDKKMGYPETIKVRETGDYEINLNGLLKEEPIIIHKNGVYTIHLPSAFNYVKRLKTSK
ncbi:MAG TPA: hypothetical protein ENG24_00405 [Thermoplasmatales archaeon]|nr:hypothetical protein [Thermoplasmata archaeon]HDM25048.1 hypothetical protein [Thermoplasmatales archaeon]